MGYRINIEDTLGIAEAEVLLEPGGVTEIVGPNASGKTSIAVAATAVLVGDANPLGLSGPQAKNAYPRDGSEEAKVTLTVETTIDTSEHDGFGMQEVADEVVWRPRSQTITAPPNVPALSRPEAVGLIDFRGNRKARERAESLQGALLPEADIVLAAVREKLEQYLQPDDLEGAMEMLAERGWEATEGVYGERARVAKREWAEIAGRTWGSKIAVDWRPDNWLADWDHLTVQMAEEGVVSARDAHAALSREAAITEAEAEAALRAAEDLAEVEEELEAARVTHRAEEAKLAEQSVVHGQVESKHDTLRRAVDDAKNALNDVRGRLRRAEEDPSRSCPHCQGLVVVAADGDLTAFSADEHAAAVETAREAVGPAEAALEAAEAALAAHEPDLKAADDDLATKRAAERDASQTVSMLTGKANTLRVAASKTGTVTTAESERALAEAEQAIENARDVLKAVRAEASASASQQTIVRYLAVAAALGPEGVRAKMLEAGLRRLTAGLAVLSVTTGWPLVTVDAEGRVTVGERPVALCSESEQWRAQASIQLTLGAITESRVAVLDRADLLDKRNREGLIAGLSRVAERTGMAILVCTTGDDTLEAADWSRVLVHGGEIVEAAS